MDATSLILFTRAVSKSTQRSDPLLSCRDWGQSPQQQILDGQTVLATPLD